MPLKERMLHPLCSNPLPAPEFRCLSFQTFLCAFISIWIYVFIYRNVSSKSTVIMLTALLLCFKNSTMFWGPPFHVRTHKPTPLLWSAAEDFRVGVFCSVTDLNTSPLRDLYCVPKLLRLQMMDAVMSTLDVPWWACESILIGWRPTRRITGFKCRWVLHFDTYCRLYSRLP